MKGLLAILILAFPIVVLSQPGGGNPLLLKKKRSVDGLPQAGSVCADSPSPYLIWQGFECSPFDHGPEVWTTNGTSSQIDPSYTGTVLAGTKSLQIIGGASQAELRSPTFASGSEYWFYFLFRPVTIQSGGFKQILRIWDDSGDPGAGRWDCTLNDDGTIRIASIGTATTVNAMSAGTTYGVWIHVQSSTIMDVGFSTTGVRPTSGNNYASISGGNVASQNMHKLSLGLNTGAFTYEFLFDNVLVKTSQIGNSPP